MDIRINGSDSNGFLSHRQRKNVDPARLLEYLNTRMICETLSIKPFIHVGRVDVAAIMSEMRRAPETRHPIGEIVVRSRQNGTLLYQDMDLEFRSQLLMRRDYARLPGCAASVYGAFGEIPALRITIHTSSDGHPARVRRSDTLYRGALRSLFGKHEQAPAHITRLFPTEEMLDRSLDGRWYQEPLYQEPLYQDARVRG